MPSPDQLTVSVEGRSYTFDAQREVIIGSARDADIRLDASFIADRHAVLRPDQGRWTFVSVDGSTYYQGDPLTQPLELSGKTALTLGKANGIFVEIVSPVSAATQATPAPGRTPAASGAVPPTSPRQPPGAATTPRTGGAWELVDATGSTTPLTGRLRVGRDPAANDLTLPETGVSRSHAVLIPSGDRLELENLSGNGTLVNGQLVSGRAVLNDGDALEFGTQRFRVARRAAAPAPSPQLPGGQLAPLPPPGPDPDKQGGGLTSIRRELSKLRNRGRAQLLIGIGGSAVLVAVAVAAWYFIVRVPTTEEIVARLEDSVVQVRLSGQGNGTGWVYDADAGIVVTNFHVISGSSEYSILLGTSERPATLLGAAPCEDLGVLQVADTAGMATLELGDQSNVRRGQPAIAIGYPTTLSASDDLVATEGVVSVPRTQLPTGGNHPNVIQVDTTINPGNSGGPLVGTDARLMGVNTWKNIGESIEGQGYAIGVDRVRELVPLLGSGRSISWTGLYLEALPAEKEGQRGLLLTDGAFPGTPAHTAGFGDGTWVITALNGTPLSGSDPMGDYCQQSASAAGNAINLTVAPVTGEGEDVQVGEEQEISLNLYAPVSP